MDRGRVLDSRIGNFLTSESEIELATETTCCAWLRTESAAALRRAGAARAGGRAVRALENRLSTKFNTLQQNATVTMMRMKHTMPLFLRDLVTLSCSMTAPPLHTSKAP